MTGETSLATIIKTLRPHLNDGDYVFCTLKDESSARDLPVVGSFREAEGLTIIVERQVAEQAGLAFDYVAAWITLNVHSALQAVGLTAAFATALGDAGVSCNVVAAYYHDHLFVGRKDADRAMEVLRDLSRTGEIPAIQM